MPTAVPWNRFTVADVDGIVRHFTESRDWYQARASQGGWITERLAVVESRVAFWQAIRPHVEAGEPIEELVEQYRVTAPR